MDPAVLALVTPLFASGILATGLTLFLLINTRYPSGLSTSLIFLNTLALVYALGEAFILLFGALGNDYAMAMQINRINSLELIYFTIVIPYFLEHLIPLSPRFHRVNRGLFWAGVVFSALFTVIAFAVPDWFKSVTQSYPAEGHSFLFQGRGLPGPLYTVRDILLGLWMCYFLAATIHHLVTKKNTAKKLLPYALASFIAIILSLDNLVVNMYGFSLIFGRQELPEFLIGISLFAAISMAAATWRFVDRAKESEKTTRDLEHSKEELVFLAYNDPLTGLPNRKSFYNKLEETIEAARRSGDTRALFLMGLDNMKAVNESLGVPFGDKLIQAASRRMRDILRASDFVYRLAGDEFAVILGESRNPTDAAFAAQKLISTIGQKFEIEGHLIYISLSIGIAIFPKDSEDVRDLIRKADLALVEAKKDRNSFRFFASTMTSEAMNKIGIINGLRQSLSLDLFELYYQPLVGPSGKVVGAEALIRWEWPELGRISPAVFIPLAESTGLINPIGSWVFRKALVDSLLLREAGFPIFLSVNLSAKQLKDPRLVDLVTSMVSGTNIPPDSVHLEITETSLVEGGQEYLKTLNRLDEAGFPLVIDDFGVGYSSLSYLKHLPVSQLKIDKSFIDPLPHGRKDAAIVRSIIDLAEGLNLEVVAEGVETEAQRDFLVSEKCDLIQGYFYSRPLPFPEFLKFLQAGKSLVTAP